MLWYVCSDDVKKYIEYNVNDNVIDIDIDVES